MKILLLIHVLAGFTALIVGLMPMLLQKGTRFHKRAGLVYVYCMFTVAVTALLLCTLQPFKMIRLFLTGIAIFSFYLCVTGWRATKQKTNGPTQADKILTYVVMAVSVGMVGVGGYLLTNKASVLAVLFAIFGFLTFKNAWYDVQSFSKRPEKMHWFYHHITRMGGSYIATFTAFLVNNAHWITPRDAPAWTETFGWITPAVVGGMLVARTVRQYKQKFSVGQLSQTQTV